MILNPQTAVAPIALVQQLWRCPVCAKHSGSRLGPDRPL